LQTAVPPDWFAPTAVLPPSTQLPVVRHIDGV
jgi:hypothetical protein